MEIAEFKIYPLTFKTIFKDRIWGGTQLAEVLNKNIPNSTTGESWEISTVKDNVSVIDGGFYAEKTLQDIIETFPEEVLGTTVFKKFGANFPLLFKYLDAQQDLSIQVHPNDNLAKTRHNSFGKTEMWYVMQAKPQATLLVGFKENSDQNKVAEAIEKNSIVSLLNKIEVVKGDTFLLNTGTVHAIGAGILIAEIQQTSDITYRLYDFDRKDSNGNLRELHIDLALEAINYEATQTKQLYKTDSNIHNQMVVCEYFTTKLLPLDGTLEIKKDCSTFTVYMCTEGDFVLSFQDQNYTYNKGQTILIPAVMTQFMLQGKATLLEITI